MADGEGYKPDGDEVKGILADHARYTGSTVAERILADWDVEKDKFVRMMPAAFKAVMAKKAAEAAEKAAEAAKAAAVGLVKSQSVGGSPMDG